MSVSSNQTGVETGLAARGRALATKHQHLLKYLIIGATASAIDVVLFFILFNFVGTSELVAHSISVPTSVLFSFAVNARHNFKTTDHTALRLLSFIIVCTIGYAAGYGVILAVQAPFSDPALGANIGKIASLPVVFVIQYVLNSKITFRKAASSGTGVAGTGADA